MPSENDHVRQSERNESLYHHLQSLISSERYTDWEITILFYSALHYADAFLDRSLGLHPKSHEERYRAIALLNQLRPVLRHYLVLLDRSRDARYELDKFSESYVQRLKDNRYEPLKAHLRNLLGLPTS